MSLYSSPPTTDQLLTEASTSAGIRRRIRVKGAAIELVLQIDRILAYRDDEDTPFAILRFGGPHSGAIWIGGQLVGEYDKDRDGKFTIIEIEAGFKQPDSRRQEDPVAHLVNHVRYRASLSARPSGS